MKTLTTRPLEMIIGLCFIIATVSYATGNALITNSIAQGQFSEKTTSGISLELLNSLCVLIIGTLTYRLLKDLHVGILRTYMGIRIFESLCLAMGAISLWLVPISNTEELTNLRNTSFNIGMLALGLISLLFCYLLLKERLMPQWISLSGMVGYLCLALYSLLNLVGFSASMLLFAPGAIFEIVYPLYLIFKGLKKPAL